MVGKGPEDTITFLRSHVRFTAESFSPAQSFLTCKTASSEVWPADTRPYLDAIKFNPTGVKCNNQFPGAISESLFRL